MLGPGGGGDVGDFLGDPKISGGAPIIVEIFARGRGRFPTARATTNVVRTNGFVDNSSWSTDGPVQTSCWRRQRTAGGSEIGRFDANTIN